MKKDTDEVVNLLAEFGHHLNSLSNTVCNTDKVNKFIDKNADAIYDIVNVLDPIVVSLDRAMSSSIVMNLISKWLEKHSK